MKPLQQIAGPAMPFYRLLQLWLLIQTVAAIVAFVWLPHFVDPLPRRALAPSGFEWMAPWIPSGHGAIWLGMLGVLALWLSRRGYRQWHSVAVLFYLPQCVGWFGAAPFVLWVGPHWAVTFDWSSVQADAVAINLLALFAAAAHCGRLMAIQSSWPALPAAGEGARGGATVVRGIAAALRASLRWLRSALFDAPVSGHDIALRFAWLGSIVALPLLELVPTDFFVPRDTWQRIPLFGPALAAIDPRMFAWQVLLIVPQVWLATYAGTRFVAERVEFSGRWGAVSVLLSYLLFGLSMTVVGLLWSGEQDVGVLILFAIVVLIPFWALPAIGAVAGFWIGRNRGRS